MNMSATYPVNVNLSADTRLARWRPLVQWLLAIPHLAVSSVLTTLRHLLTAVSFVTVLFTKRIPRQVFDAIAMTYRYEWRSVSYALFMHEQFPPFDFQPSADDDAEAPYTTVNFAYPDEMSRWKPLYKWVLAVPHYIAMFALAIASVFVIVFGLVAVVATGTYPVRARDFLVGVYRYGLRVQSYVGLLTDTYPPFAVRS
jgi:Domain of unknown function (DUF4389)